MRALAVACACLHVRELGAVSERASPHVRGREQVLVEEVPSMHTCISFLPELLSTADLSTRAFAILLAGEVARKYPLQQTEGIVNLALQVRSPVSSSARAHVSMCRCARGRVGVR